MVVLHVDEELGGGRVGVRGARHGDGAAFVLQAVLRLVLDRFAGGGLHHVGHEAAALDHEAGDDPVEDQAVVEAVLHVLPEVGAGDGSLLLVQFDEDVAQVGGQFHFAHCLSSMRFTDSMTTGSRGTSRMPLRTPVGTAAMASSTSSPRVTRPKTA